LSKRKCIQSAMKVFHLMATVFDIFYFITIIIDPYVSVWG